METNISTNSKDTQESPIVILIESKIWEKDSSYYIFTTEEDNAEKESWIFHVPRKAYEDYGTRLQIGDRFYCEYRKVNICGEECKEVEIINPLDEDYPPLELGPSHRKYDVGHKEEEEEEEDYER